MIADIGRLKRIRCLWKGWTRNKEELDSWNSISLKRREFDRLINISSTRREFDRPLRIPEKNEKFVEGLDKEKRRIESVYH